MFEFLLRCSFSAGEGHADIVEILLAKGAKSDVLDRWGRTPLDDALDGGYEDCVKLLERDGAKRGANNRLAPELELDGSGKRIISNMEINFQELQMIERIGAGAFGEIYKCRYVQQQVLNRRVRLRGSLQVSSPPPQFPLQMARYPCRCQDYQDYQDSSRLVASQGTAKYQRWWRCGRCSS